MINIDISNSMDSASEFVPLTITNMYAAPLTNYYGLMTEHLIDIYHL